MEANKNGNGNLLRTVIIVLVTSLVSYIIGFGIYTISQLSEINRTAATIKERITVLEFKVDVLERSMLARTEDRYTSRDAARDKSEYDKRFQALERKR